MKANSNILLRNTCKDILGEKIDIVDGCRILCSWKNEIVSLPKDIFKPIVRFEAKTGGYPLGKVRDVYAEHYLRELDEEYLPFIRKSRKPVMTACQALIDFIDAQPSA